MASFTPSKIATRLIRLIGKYLDEQPIGELTGADGGYIMNAHNVFMPDVGFIRHERLPKEPAREAPVPPDLAIEVKSPTDRKRDLRQKAEQYLALHTPLVWLIFPDEQVVEVYETDADVQTFGIAETLTGGTVLPNFTLPVKAIFS